MYNMDDQTRREILGEALIDELKAIRSYVQDVPLIKVAVDALQHDVAGLKSDLTVITAVIREHEHDIRTLKRRAA